MLADNRPFATGSNIAPVGRRRAQGRDRRVLRRTALKRFAGKPSRHGETFRQGGRKGRPPRRVGRTETWDELEERPSRNTILRQPATNSQRESRHEQTCGSASLPTLRFASCFAYLPNGSGPVCEQGRLLCARLKVADRAWLPRLAAQVWLEAVGHGRFAEAFGKCVVLVPVPGSAPQRRLSWVGERLAWCLRELGLAAAVWPALQRGYAVRKSALAASGERPSVLEHYASFAVERSLQGRSPIGGCGIVSEPDGPGLRLTLVDDVITRGRTLLAAAVRLQEVFPCAEISAFALLRTLGRNETLSRVLDPCEGEVRWIYGDARRSP